MLPENVPADTMFAEVEIEVPAEVEPDGKLLRGPRRATEGRRAADDRDTCCGRVLSA
jgi:hypothetical protein